MFCPGAPDDFQHDLLIGSCALALEVVEDAHFKPFSSSRICRLHVTSCVEDKAVLLLGIGHAGQRGADLAGVQIDDAVERSRLKLKQCVRPIFKNFSDVRITLQEQTRLPARNPGDRNARMRLSQRGKQRCGPQYIAHGVELNYKQPLLDFLIMVAGAENPAVLMPYTRTVAEKKLAIESNLALFGAGLQILRILRVRFHA